MVVIREENLNTSSWWGQLVGGGDRRTHLDGWGEDWGGASRVRARGGAFGRHGAGGLVGPGDVSQLTDLVIREVRVTEGQVALAVGTSQSPHTEKCKFIITFYKSNEHTSVY